VLSFVVPAYNEELTILATLSSIQETMKAVGGDYEIVVADDASTDDTAAIATRAGARVVHVENRQISKTRNAGARAAQGDRLIFVDADTQVNPQVIRGALWSLDHGAVGGGASPRFDDAAPRYARWMLKWVLAQMRWFRMAAGCFFFVRRDAFDAVGGFDERHFAGEEIMLSWALRRHGRMEILPEHVITSSRKFRSRSVWDTAWITLRLFLRGFGGARSREHTSFWYDGKR
jgi:glycosyltransferase involved in cell wall biosynthesis